MGFLADLGLFAAQALVVLIIVLLAIMGLLVLIAKSKQAAQSSNKVTLKKINAEHSKQTQRLLEEIDDPAANKTLKSMKKASKKDDDDQARLFLIRFDGDIKCSAVEPLRRAITALLSLARPGTDRALVCIKSGGGVVNTYGLAASQCLRIKNAGIHLTIAIDEVAASGGYLMAATADEIIAAPFAIIGSIGVVLQMPNFNRWLKKHNVDFEQITAGQFKRTLTLMGENTDKAREKCQEDVDHTHDLFKDFVRRSRPNLQMEQVATGEHWYGTKAVELGLVDKLQTSDDFIAEALPKQRVFELRCSKKKGLKDRLAGQTESLLKTLQAAVSRLLPPTS